MKTKLIGVVLGLAFGFGAVVQALASVQPLPDDLQFVSPDVLPKHASWFSIQRFGKYPPSPVNWCAGNTNVAYYHSPSYSANNIFIDDRLVDYSQPETASTVASSQALTPCRYGPGTGPGFGSNDLWLEILRDTNTALVDVTLHGATNGVWQLTTKTNLTDTNAWTIIEIQIDD